MYAIFHDKNISLAEIALDSFGWDKSETKGANELILYLSRTDLQKIGRKLFSYAQECIADDPDYFTGEYRQDIPQPDSVTMFVANPLLLSTYLEDSFWSREAIIAILDCMGTTDTQTKALYWIQDFRQVQVIGEDVAIKLGVWMQPTMISADIAEAQ